MKAEARTKTPTAFLIVDGPNLDGAISVLLKRKPGPDDRPDFSVFAESLGRALELKMGTKLYVATRSEERGHHAFLATLRGVGFNWKTITAARRASPADADPMDRVIVEALHKAFEKGYREFVIVTHDHDFVPALAELLKKGANVTVCCFREILHRDYDGLRDAGATIADLRKCYDGFRGIDPDQADLDDLIDPPEL